MFVSTSVFVGICVCACVCVCVCVCVRERERETEVEAMSRLCAHIHEVNVWVNLFVDLDINTLGNNFNSNIKSLLSRHLLASVLQNVLHNVSKIIHLIVKFPVTINYQIPIVPLVLTAQHLKQSFNTCYCGEFKEWCAKKESLSRVDWLLQKCFQFVATTLSNKQSAE